MTTKAFVEFDVPVPMRDGVVLRADIYRPDEGGPFPVLLHRTPYGKRNVVLQLDIWEANARGYIVVHQDVRGRFASDGDWVPWEHERNDGYDSVAWAAELPGSTGEVGMIGGSYTGSTQWSAAIAGAPALRAITPMITWRDPLDGLFMRGGALEMGLNVSWTLMTGAAHLPRQHLGEELASAIRSLLADFDDLPGRVFWELPSGQMPAIARYGGPDLGSERVLKEPRTAEFSRVAGQDAEVSVPSLSFAGWYDVFLQGSLDNYKTMADKGVPAHLIVGPWSHQSMGGMALGKTGDVNFGLTSSPTLIQGRTNTTELQLGWFDHWLKQVDDGLLDRDPVKIFVMGTNVWRDELEWPLRRAVDTPWYLRDCGRLGPETPPAGDSSDEYDFDPNDPVISRGGTLLLGPDFPSGPFDQSVAERRDDVLVYTTEPLTADLEVTGRVRVQLWAATDGPSTDWVARLCDVD